MVLLDGPVNDAPLGGIISFYRSRSVPVPVIADIGVFQLSRMRSILDRGIPPEKRTSYTREFQEFSRGLECVKTKGVYFPQGVYDPVFHLSRTLDDLANSFTHFPRAKFSKGREVRWKDDSTEDTHQELANAIKASYRSWKIVRTGIYHNTIPDAFANELREAYARTKEYVGPCLQASLGDIKGLQEPQVSRVESLVVGAITLAETDPSRSVGVVSSTMSLPDLFNAVYPHTNGRHSPPSDRSKIYLHLRGSLNETMTFYLRNGNRR